MIKESSTEDQKPPPQHMKHVPRNSDLQADLRTMGVCLFPQLLVQLVNIKGLGVLPPSLLKPFYSVGTAFIPPTLIA